ncbi:methylated-DNA--[protein]-cysteine S-methyltransferase [Endozoicomonas elysicola]|uniref:Methylated-DNA--protein-cysteine methyltransferase n=2 Tax=Endozoicomonas elysicola TaxID=305900 RepID=A0A081KEA7_9GAMM|nr:methylated-DNA--[protein]-cysteine S-methyltransferase [Endozoicomonas elysicola]KEI72483.1 cysteine methyltransferase [Endozoicomonas elysicola]
MCVAVYSIDKSTLLGRTLMHSPVGELELSASVDGIVSVLLVKKNKAESELLDVTEDIGTLAQESIRKHLDQAQKELDEYFRGELTHFNVALDLSGTDFQQQVWRALQRIEYGESCSYQDIAEGISRPKAVRAVGAANGANPVAIIVPCHRVIGKNGKLTGYAYGVEMKQYLLDLEQGNGRSGL